MADPTDSERLSGLNFLYCRGLGNADDAAGEIVEKILTECGHVMFQKYIENKAFGYATNACTEAVVSNLRMCFVTHDPGEAGNEEDWALEDEPEPAQIDSWARMHLPSRRTNPGETSPGTGISSKARSTSRNSPLARSKTVDYRQRSTASSFRAGKSPQAPLETRAAPLPEEVLIDEEEESLREAKAIEEARRREKEKRSREVEKAKEEERRQVMARHEEMRLKAHTFDSEGNIIWVEEIKADRLPKVQELAAFTLKKDKGRLAGTSTLEGSLQSGLTASGRQDGVKTDGGHADRDRRRRKLSKKADDNFSDGFSRLQHGQPPILDTMQVQCGVVLEAMGKKKAGNFLADDRETMTRREYNRLAERDAGITPAELRAQVQGNRGGGGGGGGGGEGGGPPGGAKGDGYDSGGGGPNGGGYPPEPPNGPPVPPGEGPGSLNGSIYLSEARGGSKLTDGGGGGGGGGGGLSNAPPAGGGMGGGGGGGNLGISASTGALPPLKNSTSRNLLPAATSAGFGKGRRTSGVEAPPVQRAPPAPPMSHRHLGKKFEALGQMAFQRAPRYHTPSLGGPSGLGAAQPPLGATMGHGLVRHGSFKEDYYFPPITPTNEERATSASEASLPGLQRRSPKGGFTKGAVHGLNRHILEGGDSQDTRPDSEGGRFKTEHTSPAYRAFRTALGPQDDGI